MAKFIKVVTREILHSVELININAIKTITFLISNAKNTDEGSQQFTQLAHIELIDGLKRTLKLAPSEFEVILRRLNNNESDVEAVELFEVDKQSAAWNNRPFV